MYLNNPKPNNLDQARDYAAGDKDALRVLLCLGETSDYADNSVDGDVKLTAPMVSKILIELIAVCSYNPFWQKYKDALFPLIIQGFNAWCDSEICAKSPDPRVRAAADTLKAYYNQTFKHIALLASGDFDHMRSVSEKWLGFDFDAKENLPLSEARAVASDEHGRKMRDESLHEKIMAEQAKMTEGLVRQKMQESLDAEARSHIPTRAIQRNGFQFPRDRMPHYGFQIEWWHFIGVLETEEHGKFGYQITLFKNETCNPKGYVVHVGLTDIDSGKFYSRELLTTNQFIRSEEFNSDILECAGFSFSMRKGGFDIVFCKESVLLDLKFEVAGAHLMVHKDHGLFERGPQIGKASHYYSMPKINVTGHIGTPESTGIPVHGNGWLDREWMSDAMTENQVGWDWFVMRVGQIDFMVYRVRTKDGETDPCSFAVAKGPDGTKYFEIKDFEVTEGWMHNDIDYPTEWNMTLGGDIRLIVKTLVEDQEHHFEDIRYYEGLTKVTAITPEGRTESIGHVELTGYDKPVKI